MSNKIVSSLFSEKINEGVIVISQPPMRRIVNINYSYCNNDKLVYKANFFLSFPLMHFRIQYKLLENKKFKAEGLYVISTVENNKNKAFVLPLSNIYCTGEVCINLQNKSYAKLETLCKNVIAKFWTTKFDDSMIEYYEYYNIDDPLTDHRLWQEKTKKNPNWIPNGRNLKLNTDFDKELFYGENLKRNISSVNW